MHIQTIKVPISQVQVDPKNPRILNKEKFKKLKSSIEQFPEMLEVRPLVVANGYVVGGNMRLLAMKDLGYKEVPVIDVTDWTQGQRDEFMIKDNINFGDWDYDLLANEWEGTDLAEWGMDLWETEVEEMQGLVDEDEVPDVIEDEEPITKLGDVWQLGDHRVMCGDSTKTEDVEKLMDGNKADMVFTDPPYGVSYTSNMRVKSEKFEMLKNDDKFITNWLDLLPKFSKGFVFIWTTWKVLDKWIKFGTKVGNLSNMVIWNKGGGGIGDLKKTFSTDYEVCLVYNRGAEIIGKRIGSVWSVGKDSATSYLHPTQKPVELACIAINNICIKKKIVLDVFLGSGSTLIACEKTGRICYGMELDPKYCDVIIKRWEDYTGKKAVKL